MICPSCGRKVEEGMAFCPHCGSAVIQPFMTEEDKAREDAEVEAALKSLDEIKRTAAKPMAAAVENTAPVGVAPAKRNFSTRRKDAAAGKIVIAMLGALALAVLLFVVLPRFIKPGTSSTPTIAEKDPDEQTSPIGDIPTIEELSAQDDPDLEQPVIAYNAYDNSGTDRDRSTGGSGYVISDSDRHLYTVEEVEALGLTEWQLEIARNEIYARHGRGFNDSTLQAYFDAQDWYERKYSPEEFDALGGVLSETELSNVAVIGQVEDSL